MLHKVFLLLLAATAVALLILFNYWAPRQPASLVLYTGLTVAFAGVACVIVPWRFLGIRRRRTGALLLLVGAGVVFVAMLWPQRLTRVARAESRLDGIMPEYHFSELHKVRVKASPEQVMEAVRQTTFGDIPAYVTLMRVRGFAAGKRVGPAPNLNDVRILDLMANPRSGFLPLDEDRLEIVDGMAGRPWSNVRNLGPQTRAEYDAYRAPDSIKVAFNLRVMDLGSGWSELSTETRILALDASARRKMGCYWRIIDPGSGMIRRQWVNGIRERAEKAATLARN